MKKVLLLIIGLCVFSLSCEKEAEEWECGTYNGKTLYTGKRGGCFYKQNDGDRTYVDRKHCNCLK